jgi:acetate kinase
MFMASLPILVLNSGSSSIKFSVYGTGGEPRKLHGGAVDGLGTDLGEFRIKDGKGEKLVDETPALPTRAVAFKLVADALHSKDFPAPSAIGHRIVSGGPTVQTNQRITPALIEEMERYKVAHEPPSRQAYRCSGARRRAGICMKRPYLR